MDIIMIRHGETHDNLKKIYSRNDTGLTDTGKAEILHSKELLEKFNYKKVYCSPLTRTIESMKVLDLEGDIEENIREVDFGIFTGKTFKEISKNYPKETDEWIADPINYKIPKGESVLDAYSRIKAFLNELIEKDKDSLLICHDGVIRLIFCWIFDNPNHFFRFKIDNGSMNVVSIEDDYKFIKRMNYK